MFEKKRGKRFLASVMALVMLLSLAPVGALATEDGGQPAENQPVAQSAVESKDQTNENTPTEPAKDSDSAEATKSEGGLDEGYNNVDADTSNNNDNGIMMHRNGPSNGGNNSAPSEPSAQYERLYVTILDGTTFPNEPGFSHKYGYDFVKKSDNNGYNIEAYLEANYNSNRQVFSTQAGNFIKVNDFNNADLTNNGNVKGLYNANGIDLSRYTNFTENDANAIAAAYATYKGLDTSATYKLVPYVLKYEDHGPGPDAPSTGYHLDCIVVKNQTVLVKYDINGATTSNFQLPDNTYVTPGSDVAIGSWKNSSGTAVADNSITAQKGGKDVTFVGWSENPNADADSQDLYKADDSLQNISEETTLYAIWKGKEEEKPTPSTDTVEAKYFVLMPSANAPSSGKDQGKENYFPSECKENGTTIKDDGGVEGASRATGYAGKITQAAADLVKNKGDNGYFQATGVEDTYLAQKPTNLGYFDANNYNKGGTTWTYAGHGKLPATLTGFTMEGKEVVWYVIKNVGTETKPDYHVDGYVKGVDIEVNYHQNFTEGTSWPQTGLKSGNTVKIKDYATVWPNSSRTGYTFTGWNTKADGTGDSHVANSEEVLKTSIDLYAQWEQNYTVIFDANGGQWGTNASIEGYEFNTGKTTATSGTLFASSRVSSMVSPTNGQKKFLGWAESIDSSNLLQLTNPTVAELKNWANVEGTTITLYAIWENSPVQYTYNIHQHFKFSPEDDNDRDTVNVTGLKAEQGKLIAELISDKEQNEKSYIYDASYTTVDGAKYNKETSTLTKDNTDIDL